MFIQVIEGGCQRQDEVRALLDEWTSDLSPTADGWLGGTHGFTDDGRLLAVVRFESREAAEANSGRPEQGRWWGRVEPLLTGPVEFRDSDRVLLMLGGGSDDAGFVQVVRGRLVDPDALERNLPEVETLLHEARPEIIGATFAIEPDGAFTETVYFTDEESARSAESTPRPDSGAMQEAMGAWEAMVRDLTFHDLHRPWFASRG